MFVVCANLIGYEPYIATLCDRMGIELTSGTATHLNKVWESKVNQAAKQKKPSHKREHQEGKRTKMEMEIQAAEKKRRKES
jgi:hypothetical protein